MSTDDDEKVVRVRVYDVPCPTCGAARNESCAGAGCVRALHPERVKKAWEAALPPLDKSSELAQE